MTTYTDLDTWMETPSADRTTLLAQIRTSVSVSALAITAEDPATAGHAARASLALRAIQAPAQVALQFMPLVLSQGNLTIWAAIAGGTMPPDSDIQFAVNACWNAVAGYAG